MSRTDTAGPASWFQREQPVEGVESPSLCNEPGEQSPAYELKLLLSPAQALELEVRASDHLVPDPHADPAQGNSYQTTSLYLDTAALDVFYRTGPDKRRKLRVRRYGDEASLFLEEKAKSGNRVRKRRTTVPKTDLSLLGGHSPAADWPGHWFHQDLVERRLTPVCRVTYQRVALVGPGHAGLPRLTIDRELRGDLVAGWDVLEPVHAGPVLMPDWFICEFKYRGFLPGLFKDIMTAMRLTPGPVSKYRLLMQATGRAAGRRARDA